MTTLSNAIEKLVNKTIDTRLVIDKSTAQVIITPNSPAAAGMALNILAANIAPRNYTIPDNGMDGGFILTDATQTMGNKTLINPVISTIVNTGVLTLPTSTDTIMGRDTTDIETNKTIADTSNTITVGGTVIGSLINQDVRSTASPTYVAVTLQTTGGTPSALSYYEQAFVYSTNYTGIWAVDQAVTFNITRIGNVVTIMQRTNVVSAAQNTPAQVTVTSNIPSRFRPGVSVYGNGAITDNGDNYVGAILIDTAGQIFISISNVTLQNFTGTGTGGIFAWSMTYQV